MLLVNNKFQCETCKKTYAIRDYSYKEVFNLMHNNKDKDPSFLSKVAVDLRKRIDYIMSLEGYEDSDIRFARRDNESAYRTIDAIYNSGYNQMTVEKYNSGETYVRDMVVDYLIDFFEENSLMCVKCSESKPKKEPDKKKEIVETPYPDNLTLEKIYEKTDNKLGKLAIEKMALKLNAVKENKANINELVTYKGKNVPIKFGARPYHIIIPFENVELNITPYMVWAVSRSGKITPVYNTVKYRYKTPINNIYDLRSKFGNHNIFNFAYMLYEGRKNKNTLLTEKFRD